MNTFHASSSAITGVAFGLLSTAEVRKLSVKRVTSANTFDALLNPVPGGLYDPAFGAVLDNACSTCRLDVRGCPGHCGHIELPTRVYHCTFIDQAYRLLRAQCYNCHRFRMSKAAVDLYWCKLKLVQHGLLAEAEAVVDVSGAKGAGEAGAGGDDSDDEVTSAIFHRRAYVKAAVRDAKKHSDGRRAEPNEATLAARKAIITEFKKAIVGYKVCENCKATSASYRKDRATAIYRKPMNSKDKARNVKNGIETSGNLLSSQSQEKARRKADRVERARIAAEIDEGVADMDSSLSSDENQAGIVDDVESESASEQGGDNLIAAEAMARSKPKTKEKESEKETYINSAEIFVYLDRLFNLESEILSLIYQPLAGATLPSADMFFVSSLVVPPSKYRKEAKTGRDQVTEAKEHEAYKLVLNISTDIWEIQRELQNPAATQTGRLRNYDDLNRAFLRLQNAVNSIFDSEKSGVRGAAALRVPPGIKQKLEKKEGVFRSNIMGKRVNFAARSVISPDPNIETNEVGVPPVFAKTLTYPEPVTQWSFEDLKQAVRNGPDKWPGANAVEYETGQVVTLKNKTEDERLAIANLLLAPSNTSVNGTRPKKVHRHLNNGDMVIMNRQPTLHKPSMMCHRARILHGEKTIRMHYANCNTYNADFDGDEMNMHFPQNEHARIEAMEIADTDHQYLSATAGEPLRGLIQDHVSMGTWLTCVDMFFTREEYHELLYAGIRPETSNTEYDRVLLEDPAILKPVPRWTGKQVVTTILRNIKPRTHATLNVTAGCQVSGKLWENDEESKVRVVNGELLTGVMDKKHIGPKTGGLVHSVYEVYGPTAAGRLLSIIGRVLTRLLNKRAFSCGMEDLVLTQDGNDYRKDKLKAVEDAGLHVAAKYVMLDAAAPSFDRAEMLNRLEDVFRDGEKQENLDTFMNGTTKDITTKIWGTLPTGLVKRFPKNQMQLMTSSGAKGTAIQPSQISCNLGQQVLEGRRVPTMVSGKTLPSFAPFETHVRAGGYIRDRFLTGLHPQEYYFTLMAGREGLIDTAVKTARSGYLQRCLIKGLEGLHAGHDSSVRDSDGTLIQTLYGEDGLEVIKTPKLMDFAFLSRNFLSLFASLNVREDAAITINEDAIEWNRTATKKVAKTGDLAAMDPVVSVYPPFAVAGSTSEKFYLAAKKYINDNPDKTIRSKDVKDKDAVVKSIFQRMLNVKYARSVVEPGEAVGVVAGQSVGEPSTQMTLNTFHLAGFAAKNVTLGIPRLRELLMTASKEIRKPAMRLYPINDAELDPATGEERLRISDADCEQFAKGISRLSLAEIVDTTLVRESIGDGKIPESRVYTVRLNFFDAEEYTQEYAITRADVGAKLEQQFLRKLREAIKKEIRKRKSEKSLKSVGASDSLPGLGQSVGRAEEETRRPQNEAAEAEGGDSDSEEGGDDDATDAKRRANLDEGVTYEDPDSSDEEIERKGEEDAADELADSDDERPDREHDEGYEGSEGMASGSEDELTGESKDRAARIKHKFPEVTAFRFNQDKGNSCEVTFEYPASTPRLLLLGLVNKAAHATLIQEVSGLKACVFMAKSLDDSRHIMTEGCNLKAMHQFQDVIDPHQIYANDIWAMHQVYGVEAARNVIIAEIQGVFGGHSIDVDVRHLTLIADYMTRDGGYLAFSRIGMRDKSSPFAKMSFETTIGFLSGAIMDDERESLSSPSARITIGRVGKIGSGMSEVLLPMQSAAQAV